MIVPFFPPFDQSEPLQFPRIASFKRALAIEESAGGPDHPGVLRILGSPTTTRFTRTRLSDIVHRVSSSQLTQDPDRVRSVRGLQHVRPTHACKDFAVGLNFASEKLQSND